MLFSKKSTVLILLSATLLSSLFFVSNVKAAQLTWSIETVDAALSVGTYSSIALDSNNRPHISYYDYYWDDLKYVRWTGSTWYIQAVHTVGSVGTDTSLALDSNNNAHISYYDITNEDLRYLRLGYGGGWSEGLIDSTGKVGVFTSIAVDSNEYAHISYYDSTNKNLKYARETGPTWVIETVDSNGDVGSFSSLAIDSNDRPHIVYFDESPNYNLKYARWTGTSWAIETVDSNGNVGYYASLALDSSDNPHISYLDNYPYNLKYAKKTGTSWIIETVDASHSVGQYTSIALDSNDYPHISYYDNYWGDLKYAKMTDLGWLIKNIDNVGDVGGYTSIALDSSNHPHISYNSFETGDLKYTRDPDESVKSVTYDALDDDGDFQNDGVKVTFDVDTTYSGTLPVFVYTHLTDYIGNLWATNNTLVSITSDQSELTSLTLTIPQNAPQGLYSIYVVVEDDALTIEDVFYLQDEITLYPPNTTQGGTLQGTITDFETSDPISYAEIQINGYTTYTNSSGQYSIGVPAGTYSVVASEEVYSSVTVQGVTILDGSTTTQNIVLQRSHYVLDLQIEGSGTLNPGAGYYSYLVGSEIDVQATPDPGWTFAYWLLDVTHVGSVNPYSVTMDSNHALKAVFIEEGQIGFLQGTVTDFDSGLAIVEAEVVIGDAWFLTNSTGDYALELEPGEYVVVAGGFDYQFQEAPVTIIAGSTTVHNFALEKIPRTLMIEVIGSGTTDPIPGEHQISSGTEISIEAFPGEGWMLSHWVLGDTNIGSENPFSIILDIDQAVAAIFMEIPVGENQGPIANLSVNSTTVDVDQSVLCDADDSYDPDGQIVLYFIDFGDGTNSEWISSSSVSHSYSTPGTYSVSLQVQDNEGLVSSSETTLSVTLTVIPEIPSWLFTLLFLVATIVVVLLKQRFKVKSR
ncbi:carboxypeptidase regulatory-like domain-containing protein [Thermoproteota archaeon]